MNTTNGHISATSIRFGTILPLYSDPELGETAGSLRDGYTFAIDTINSDGGITIGGEVKLVELSIRTCAYDATQLRHAYKELIEKDGVQILLGAYPALANQVGMEEAELAGLPFITASGAGEFAFDRGFRYSFGLFTPARKFLFDAVDAVLAGDRTVRSFAVTGCDRPEAQEDVVAIHKYCVELGLDPIPVLGHGRAIGCFDYPHGNQDFDLITRVLRAHTPDLLISACHLIDAVPSAVCAAKNRLQPRHWIVADGPTDKHFQDALARVGFCGDGFFEPLQWSPDIVGEFPGRYVNARAFALAFEKQFGRHADGSSSGAAACGFLCEQAIKVAGSTRPKDIRNALESIGQQGTQTFFGPVRFDHRGINIAKPIVTVQVCFDNDRSTSRIICPNGNSESVLPVRSFAWKPLHPSLVARPAEVSHVKNQFEALATIGDLPIGIRAAVSAANYDFKLYGELASPSTIESVSADLQDFINAPRNDVSVMPLFVASFKEPYTHNDRHFASLAWLHLQQMTKCHPLGSQPLTAFEAAVGTGQLPVSVFGKTFTLTLVHAATLSPCRFAYPTMMFLLAEVQ